MLKKKKENEEVINKENNPGANTGENTPAEQTASNAAGTNEGDEISGSQTGNDLAGETTAEGFSADAAAAGEEASTEENLRQEINNLNDKYLRLFAEFDNFKRRSARERIELVGTASKSVILALLPVLDDFDRAQKSMESAEDMQAVKEGIDLIITKFRNILSQQGVREMQSVGEPFDADLHEAVTSVPAPSEELKGKVVDQLEKGYYLNDKVIRFAKVLVGA